MQITNRVQDKDFSMIIRALFIATLLIFDSLFGRYRSIPPVSIIYSSVITLIIGIWLIYKIRKRQGLPRTPFTIPFTVYIAAISVSTFFSVDQRRSLDTLIGSFAVILIFFVICDLLLKNWKPESLEWSVILFVSFLLIQGIVEIVKWFWMWFSLSVPEYPVLILEYRLFGVSSWPNILGMLIYVTLPFVVFRMTDSNRWREKIFWFIWIIVAEIVFFFADSRGALFASMIVIMVTCFWLIYRKGIPLFKNHNQWFSANKFIFLSLAFFFSIYYVLDLVFRDSSSHSGFVRHGGGFSGGRFYFWEIAKDIFTRYPVFGSGPGTYSQFYLEINPSGIVGWISPHAHNIIFDTASSIGFLGLLGLFLILVTFLIILARNFLPITKLNKFKENVHQRYIIGGGSALIAFITHSMVDRLTAIPHSIIPVLIILVLFLFALDLIEVSEKRSYRKAYLYLLILLIVFLSIFPVYQARSAQINGLLSINNHDWMKAVEHFENASRLDHNFKLYKEQLGYAYGALATSSDRVSTRNSLNQSISKYEEVVDYSDYWAPNYVNLSYLQNHSGNTKAAINTIEEIPSKWMNVWNFPNLLLGNYFESIGETERSNQLYQNALSQNIWSQETAICLQSKQCREIEELNQDNEEYLLHKGIITLLEFGEANTALLHLSKIPINESSSLTWIDRASAHIQLGEINKSKFALLIAEKLNAQNNPSISSYFAFIKAQILMLEESPSEALEALEYSERPIFGSRYYETMLYNRIGIGDYLLPHLTLLQKNKYNLQNLQLLEELYNKQNRYEEANWAKNQANELSILLKVP